MPTSEENRDLSRLSRRDFLRCSAWGLLALGMPLRSGRFASAAGGGQLGRVLDPTVDIYRQTSFASDKVDAVWRDDVLTIDGAEVGDEIPEYNRIWYQVHDRGYVHSSAIQPVRNEPNVPLKRVPYAGLLVEITVPFVDAYWKPQVEDERAYRFYYGSTFWVIAVTQDSGAHRWYSIIDDKYEYFYFARAEAFRPIPLAELTPISPEVPPSEKRIEVSLAEQWVECYEGTRLVSTSKVSTGKKFDDGSYWTPQGEFTTFRKRSTRHMTAGNLATGYDLPGVPWVSYITEDGVSFHGTYWHNDFGAPRSHGCINMTPQAAKWLYRWTQPVVPSGQMERRTEAGTRVLIHA
jgi:lipoprotein-anchoring transpeptidase ErfK/SrfK